jgi:UDP-N-acetylmuramate dehydrogenase
VATIDMNMADNPHTLSTRLLPSALGETRLNEPMAKHVTWRAGGAASRVFTPNNLQALCAAMPLLDSAEPIVFVGLGSNLLIRDGGFNGTVVFTHRALTGVDLIEKTETFGVIEAGAGIPSPHVARFAANSSLAGAEWLAGVPGTIGGALAMNAGCYGSDTWSCIVSTKTVDRNGHLNVRTSKDFDLGYRHVEAKQSHEEWFVSAQMKFAYGDKDTARSRIKELLAKRVATQPLNFPNAGSVFRNPPNDFAARLIESCGLKGFQIGGAQVSPKHANFIVNVADASAQDIESIIELVQKVVKEKTSITLIKEVRVIGTITPTKEQA